MKPEVNSKLSFPQKSDDEFLTALRFLRLTAYHFDLALDELVTVKDSTAIHDLEFREELLVKISDFLKAYEHLA